MKTQRNCGNCHHFNLTGELSGDCKAPIPTAVSAFWFRRKSMLDTSGTDCPAHRMKVVRKGKPQVMVASAVA